MYDISTVVANIKNIAKEKGISTTAMLSELGLNKNMLSSMSNRGSWPASDSLAKIADRLGVSMDSLLGREIPESLPPDFFSKPRPSAELAEILSGLSDDDLIKVQSYVDFLHFQRHADKNGI